MSDIVHLPEAKTENAVKVVARIEAFNSVLPPNIIARQFMATVIGEMNAISDDKCSWQSAVKAVYACAMLGLIPGSALGHAYFIPYKRQLKLVIGYRGFLDLAYSCDFLRDVHCDVVLQGEPWRFWKDETGPRVLHEVGLDRMLSYERVLGAYCIYHTQSGGHGIKVVTRKELDRVNTGQNVWASDPIAMSMKTPLRRAAKEWRMTSRLGMAIQLDEQQERGEEQEFPATDVITDTVTPFSLKEME